MSGNQEDNNDGGAPRKSLKDRIAMFNQPKVASPPPIAKKPVAFKWKTSGEGAATSQQPGAVDDGSKAVSVPDIPPPAPTATPAPASGDVEPPALIEKGAPLEPVSSRASIASVGSASSTNKIEGGSGLSAADAREKSGSLKDRIALLSGLKVDQPGLPGRPLKPWKKKPEPSTEAESNYNTAIPGSDAAHESPEDIKVDIAKAQEVGLATDTPGEPISDETHQFPSSNSPTDNLSRVADLGATSINKEDASSNAAKGGVALPAMPTRARGPPRKAKSGAAAAGGAIATTPAVSPTAEQVPTNIEQSLEERAPTMEAPVRSINYSPNIEKDVPSVQELSRPAAGPSDFLSGSQETPEIGGEGAEALEGSEPLEQQPLNRASIGLPLVEGIRAPPKNVVAAAIDDNDAVEEDGEEDDEEGKVGRETSELEESMARQTLQSPSEDPRAATAEPVDRATPTSAVPSRKSTSGVPSPVDKGTPDTGSDERITGPPQTSRPINRRSMTKPPIPIAFQRAPSIPLSAKSSLDKGGASRSIPGEDEQPGPITAEPDTFPGHAESVKHAFDSASISSPAQPPVPKPNPTNVNSTTPKKALGPREAPSVNAGLASDASPSRQASFSNELPNDRGARPLTDSTKEDEEKPETNISASSTYRSPVADEEEEDGDQAYEDPEVARRQALARRMAAMGGMKLGMMPMLGTLKRQKTMPKEQEVDNSQPRAEEPASPTRELPSSPMRDTPASPVREPPMLPLSYGAGARPSPVARSSHLPPPGAFVLPGIGKPAVPPAAGAAEEEPVKQSEEDAEEPASPNEEAADKTITSDESQGVYARPPLPGGRPSRSVPLPGQSFIDDDTDTDGVASKRTSLQSSIGVGTVPDFPAPPGEKRIRTESSISTHSGHEQEALTEEPEEGENLEEGEEGEEEGDEGDQGPPPLPPSRPGRPAPATVGVGTAQGSYDEREPPASPGESATSKSQRSLPSTPHSSHGRQSSFTQLSPTPSASSRKSTTTGPAQPGQPAQGGGSTAAQPGLTHAYLAWIATSAIKTKARDLDGQLATVIHDISYTHRANPANFGQLVYRMLVRGEKGTSPDLQIHGKIETGSVFLAWDAKFDRGLGRSSLKIGSAEVPHIGIVAEDARDVKKARIQINDTTILS
ncbi:MAG: hypothetical protein CYPHOPRED_005622 [Cyphobasidiales sp. Tagirdzhanova-0007]|nr:MAG: hypothetical protein CYPHOPRED_005622 [Cyphobasidiales sp. Tagirdzhanova-0007]